MNNIYYVFTDIFHIFKTKNTSKKIDQINTLTYLGFQLNNLKNKKNQCLQLDNFKNKTNFELEKTPAP